ncbi:MAG: hypothetical protein LYZ69_08260 [Nitrososphaerales archaeon]|nr:hypothetical protein [Nitrososphaerales archaeon]
MEVAHFLIRNLGPVKGQSKVAEFLGFPMVVADFDYGTLLDSVGELAMNSHFGVGGRDATLLASMKKFGWKRIMTHDSALKKIDWLDVQDPVG